MKCTFCSDEIQKHRLDCIACDGTGKKMVPHHFFWNKWIPCWYCDGTGKDEETFDVMGHYRNKHPDLVDVIKNSSYHYYHSSNTGGFLSGD